MALTLGNNAEHLIERGDEFRIYMERKVKEGKNKMLILNNIRNKIIHRVCAVIQRQTPYEKKLVPGLV